MENSNYPSFVKYPRIPHLVEKPSILSNSVNVFEKLDGGNSQVRYYKGRILAGNRSKFLSEKDKKFEWFQQFLKWAKSNYSLFNLSEKTILYGEWLSYHTLEYFPKYRDNFYLIDFFDMESGEFLDYSKAKEKIKELGIKDIKLLNSLFEGKISEKKLENLVINRRSDYRDGYMEGVVIKDYSSQSFIKLWRKSLFKKKITKEDIQRQMFVCIEGGKKISRSNLVRGIIEDLECQKIPYDFQRITGVVDSFLKEIYH
jgi:ATP-dependent RNA circularization protein (DNA/RNA ligase family)